MLRLLALTLLVAAPAARPASAQAPRAPWTVAVRHQSEVFDSGRQAWHLSDVTLERRFGGGAVLLGGGRTERFGRAAAVATAEVYKTLTPRMYASARLSAAPGAATVARTDAGLRVYHTLPGRLEGMAGVRRIDYADGGATLLLAGADAYRPWGRLGGVATLVPGDSLTGVSLALSARADLGRGDARAASYVVLRGGRGEELAPTAGGGAELRTSWTASLGGAVRVGRRATLSATAGRVWDSSLARATGEVRLAVDV